MALTPPAMTPAEVAASPLFAPPVRVTCYPCGGTTLFVGETVPDGGAEAVFEAAGCAKGTCPGLDPDAYPAPPAVVDLTATAPTPAVSAASAVLPHPAPGIEFAAPAAPATALPA